MKDSRDDKRRRPIQRSRDQKRTMEYKKSDRVHTNFKNWTRTSTRLKRKLDPSWLSQRTYCHKRERKKEIREKSNILVLDKNFSLDKEDNDRKGHICYHKTFIWLRLRKGRAVTCKWRRDCRRETCYHKVCTQKYKEWIRK